MSLPRGTSAIKARAGITLTEILISILIMGVGMISLATLFPLGLVRIRTAAQNNRSALFSETIASDVPCRNLLTQQSFLTTWYGPSTLSIPFSPLTADPLNDLNAVANNGGLTAAIMNSGNQAQVQVTSVVAGPGIPFCYDPLWRSLTNTPPFSGSGATQVSNEARFAFGEGVIRTDPDGNPPSAHGLQRLTNLPAGGLWPPFPQPNASTAAGQTQLSEWNTLVGNIFASQDDPVMQTFSASPNVNQGRGSPLVSDLSSLSGPQNDWSYTWMFTGRQSDVSNPSNFDGDIVVFQNRPFGYELLTNKPYSNTFTPTPTYVASGEVVVEAVWGYAAPRPSQTSPYYDSSPSSRTVLLRWPASVPDPDVRVGGWIADVTYERVAMTSVTRFGGLQYPGQRCFWYRVAKKTAAEAETGGNLFDSSGLAYRQMIVTLTTPVRAKTLLSFPPASGSAKFSPVNVNAALVAPSVVNVFSQVFYAR